MTALGLSTINGLPAHVLIIHLVVVFVPLSAVALIAAAFKPSVARRLGVWLPALAGISFVSVLAAMNAGDWLESHVQDTALVHRHTELAGQLWPFSAAVLALALAVWWFQWKSSDQTGDVPSTAQTGSAGRTVLIGALSVLLAIGSIVEVYRIGDSGAKASWHNNFSSTSVSHSDSD